ncbi:class I SAM-dependent methyltransferase [Acanthopleuribacter pedis]|uniref:Class I SAM-dependent methyltransferase n=1 Tax=Acanthopleuribacter pedis TaxID=442870 RepID=A0A8J7U747_9BACT|nr:class I SAM-dependent methyltransferase [Acanthopleuribacter pedis]MBO1321036.1 class I SAM-dependent methyltransferase [Acanthopleuribacter pedis]
MIATSFGSVQNRITDHLLTPIRHHLTAMIEPGTTVLEAGCRSGDLLFRAAPKIHRGLGLDLNPAMIREAHRRRASCALRHVDFVHQDPAEMRAHLTPRFDFAAVTLCLHSMAYDQAVESLQRMFQVADRLVVAELDQPQTRRATWRMEIDEWTAGHYSQFRTFRRKGWFPAMVETAGLHILRSHKTEVDGIRIFEIV